MQLRKAPVQWRSGFALHRKRLERDSLGESRRVYDMEHPDLLIQDGDERSISWQAVRSWQSSGRLSSGEQLREYGYQNVATLQGVCRWALETDCGDRFVLHDGVYELKQIQQWPSHRLLLLERVK